MDDMGINVALLGYGAIGQAVHRMLAPLADQARVVGVLDRISLEGAAGPARMAGPAGSAVPVLDLAAATKGADVVLECASPAAVRAYGPGIVGAGTDLLVASLGALVDDRLRSTLLERGPGRCFLSTGAIGGLDLVRASAGTIDAITLETRKPPAALLHRGLGTELRSSIVRADATGAVGHVFGGSVAEAVRLFPSNINVAAALGLAAGNMDLVRVDIIADPGATLTSHAIEVRGSGGTYRFAIENFPDPANLATSTLTARSLVSGLLRLAGHGPLFI
ncbi:aspartate dehydrogenase domain-containing protein [Paeniglutamicibacter sp. ORCA_105]|uniref:aspartate dehydrogenase domain-containing protein n=1 Tax=Paeniglutamicibacter sp. ORCA_105 TaxID=3377336 RepID=UPI003893E4F0